MSSPTTLRICFLSDCAFILGSVTNINYKARHQVVNITVTSLMAYDEFSDEGNDWMLADVQSLLSYKNSSWSVEFSAISVLGNM